MDIAPISPSGALPQSQPAVAVLAAAEAEEVQMLNVLASGGQSGLGAILDLTV